MNIVITGASRGIGQAIAERFAEDKEGHTFYLCARNEEALSAMAKSLAGRFPESTFQTMPCDLSLPASVKDFAQLILKQAATVDILVNNAGIFIPGNVYDEEDGLLEKIMQINLFAPYQLTRLLIPSMISQRNGHIFNIASIAALQAYPGGGSYGISKYALDGFSKNLRHEMKEFGIKVTIVYPGATYTDSWKSSGLPEDRFMKTSDIAEMIHSVARLSPQACVEEIVIRPQLGDI